MKLQLKNVRLAFPHLFEPQASQDGKGEPKYNAVFILAPNSPEAKALDAAVEAVAKEKWGAKATGILTKLRNEGRVCFHKYAKTDKTGEVYNGFADTYHVNASNAARPLVIDRDKTPLTLADGRPYAGSYVNGNVEIWAQDNNFGQRINATLRGVQFVRDGDPFTGGQPASVDEFDVIEPADDEVEFA